MSILRFNKRKKGKVSPALAWTVGIIIIAGIGFGAYYGLHKKDTKPSTTQVLKSNTEKSATDSSSNTTQDDGNKVTPAVLTKMKAGFNDGALGNISPIPSWYNPSEIVPGENLIKSALSYAVPANEIADMVAGNSNIKQKEVFLTFDDGPSIQNTQDILNILKEYGVHATFCLIGDHMQNNPQVQNLVREEIMDGNAIGDHTYTHVLSQLYPNNKIDVNEFMKQINECEHMEQAILGPNFDTKVVRLPGGYMSRVHYNDPNLPAFNAALDKGHFTAIDWTADSGVAATTKQISPAQMLYHCTLGYEEMPQDVILMHDAGAKRDTVEGLPDVIKFFKEHGYKFMVIKNAPASSFNDLPLTDVRTDSNQGQSQAVLDATKKADTKTTA